MNNKFIKKILFNIKILTYSKEYVKYTYLEKFEKAQNTFEKIVELFLKSNHNDDHKLAYNFLCMVRLVKGTTEYRHDFNLDLYETVYLEQIFDQYETRFSQTRFKFDIISEMYYFNVGVHNVVASQRFLDMIVESKEWKKSVVFLYNAVLKSFGRIDIKYINKINSNYSKNLVFTDNLERISILEKMLMIKANSFILDFDIMIDDIIEYFHSNIKSMTSEEVVNVLKLEHKFGLNAKENIEKYVKDNFINSDKICLEVFDDSKSTLLEKNKISKKTNIHMDIKSRYISKEDVNNKLIKILKYNKFRIKSSRKIGSVTFYSSVLFNSYKLYRYNNFFNKMDKELKKVKPVRKNDGLMFFVNDYSLVCSVNAFPLLMSAKRSGYTVIPTSLRTIGVEEDVLKNEKLLNLYGTFSDGFYLNNPNKATLKRQWNVDIENKYIGFNDMNFYQPIYEFVSRYQFDFFYNYESDIFTRFKTGRYMLLIENTIDYIEEIVAYAKEENKSVNFVGFAPHFPNNAAFRIFCENNKSGVDMSYIVTAAGYDNYFNNIGEAKTYTFCALNLTKNRDSRSCFLGTKDGFDEYFEKSTDEERNIQQKKASSWIELKRSSATAEYNINQKKIIEKIEDYKNRGKKVFLANGKVVFDLAVFYTKGVIHEDMSDWITNTVEVMKDSENLLIIKPHPHELNRNLTMSHERIRTFVDLIKTSVPDNVIVLGNRDFNLFELIKYIDCGLMWNGTSTMELASMGVPVYLFDEWGYKDYPIGLPRINTNEEYRELLIDGKIDMKDLKVKAVSFLNYMGSTDVCKKNIYTQTSSLNFHQFSKSIINSEAVDNYTINGDLELDEYVEDILA